MNPSTFFKVFLVLYALLLVSHVAEMEWHAAEFFIPATVGLVLAVIAHSRFAMLAIILLIAHMSIEWAGYALHAESITLMTAVLLAIHVGMDFTFLYQELRTHYHKHRWIVFCVVALAMPCIALTARLTSHAHDAAHSHAHSHGSFTALIIGGILGCIISHLARQPVRTQGYIK